MFSFLLSLQFLPWCGVAALLAKESLTDAALVCPPTDGRAFCFLPLPVTTKLPVHVNAYFDLSKDRRGLLLASSDLTGEST